MHAKDEKTEEDRDSDQRDGGWRGKELPIIDSEVPDHREQDHKHGDHQTSCAESHSGRSQAPAKHRAPPGSGVLFWGGLVERLGLGDVTMEHAVVGDVQRQERALGVLKELTLVDELYLLFTAREVLTL